MRISIVVPSYNAAKTIATTLDSLLAQSLAADEIVVVDDGSGDETRAALEPYRDRVRVVFQENSGVSAARNRGVAESSGEWVAFCDADDVWHRDKLRIVAAVVESRPDIELVFHDFWTIVSGRVVERRATHSTQTMFPLFQELDVTLREILPEHGVVAAAGAELAAVDTWSGNAFRWLMLGNFLMPSTVAVRRASFLSCGGFDTDFKVAEDTEFFLRFAKTAPFLWIDASLAGYRRAAGSLVTGNMLLTVRNGTRAVVKNCVEDEAVYSGADREWVRRAVSRRFTRLAYFCLSDLRPAEARGYAREGLRHHLGDLRAWAVLAGSVLPIGALKGIRWLKDARRAAMRPHSST